MRKALIVLSGLAIGASVLIGCQTYSGVIPTGSLGTDASNKEYDIFAKSYAVDEINALTVHHFANMSEVTNTVNGSSSTTTVMIGTLKGSANVNAESGASGDVQTVEVLFTYLRYGSLQVKPAVAKAKLASFKKAHNGEEASDVGLLVGGYVTYDLKINTASIKISGSILGAVNAALAAGATTASAHSDNYGWKEPDVSFDAIYNLIPDGSSQDSIGTVSSVLRALDGLKPTLNTAMLGYVYQRSNTSLTRASAKLATADEMQAERAFVMQALQAPDAQ